MICWDLYLDGIWLGRIMASCHSDAVRGAVLEFNLGHEIGLTACEVSQYSSGENI